MFATPVFPILRIPPVPIVNREIEAACLITKDALAVTEAVEVNSALKIRLPPVMAIFEVVENGILKVVLPAIWL